mgnify:CR=1
MKELEKQLKAVANRRRLAILKYLKQNREAVVSDIAQHIKLSFRSTSKHLSILAANDIVDREQRSLHMFYSLSQSQRQAVSRIISLL